MKKIRLKDIASMANVSETTVSLVLNNAPSRISKEKKEEIMKLAEENNYRPNYLARSLSMNKTHTIGLLIPDIENPFFSTLSKCIEDDLRAHGYMVLMVNSDDKKKNDVLLIQELINRNVDGVLIAMSNESYADKDFKEKVLMDIQKPYVLVDRSYDDKSINQVSFDNELGGYIATKHLLMNGHKNIACVSGRQDTYSGRRRFEGYVRALKEFGLEVKQDMVFEGDYKFESGYQNAKHILKNKAITAVFACNDLMAYGLLKGMHEKGIKEADDISVVGYDNLKQSEMFGIPLTSIHQNIKALSECAIKQLLNQIADKKAITTTILNPELIEKTSVKHIDE